MRYSKVSDIQRYYSAAHCLQVWLVEIGAKMLRSSISGRFGTFGNGVGAWAGPISYLFVFILALVSTAVPDRLDI